MFLASHISHVTPKNTCPHKGGGGNLPFGWIPFPGILLSEIMKNKDEKNSPNREREIQFSFRVNEAESNMILKRARTSKSVSEYLRKIATTGKVVIPPPAVDRETLIELTRIGNNINQIAHRVNQSEANIFHKSTKKELQQNLQLIQDLLKDKINLLDDLIYKK